jgi:hypothetical protein
LAGEQIRETIVLAAEPNPRPRDADARGREMSTFRYDPTFDPGKPHLHVPDYPLESPSRTLGRPVVRTIYHADPYAPRGIDLRCPNCFADRNWLLIQTGNGHFVRCRCGHDWREPELTKADFNAMFTHIEQEFDGGLEDIYVATGFDGTFSGVYL